MKFTIELEYMRMQNASSRDVLTVLLDKYGLTKADVPRGESIRRPTRGALENWAEKWNGVTMYKLANVRGERVVDVAINTHIVRVYNDRSVDSEVVIVSDNARAMEKLAILFAKSMHFSKKAGMHISTYVHPKIYNEFLKQESLSTARYIDTRMALYASNLRGITREKAMTLRLYDVYRYFNKLAGHRQRIINDDFKDEALIRFARNFMSSYDWGCLACLSAAIEKQMLKKVGRRPRGGTSHYYYQAHSPSTLQQRAFRGSKYNIVHGKMVKHKHMGATINYPFFEFRLHAPIPTTIYPYLIYIPELWAELKFQSIKGTTPDIRNRASSLIAKLSNYYSENIVDRGGDWWNNRQFQADEVLDIIKNNSQHLLKVQKHLRYLDQWRKYNWEHFNKKDAQWKRLNRNTPSFYW